ncbi:MAG: RDD family protein [Pirellulales bacterium]|nr:RDD family protein [Pirellulales bacterium]
MHDVASHSIGAARGAADWRCPLCGAGTERRRHLYGHWVCQRCGLAFVNRRRAALLFDLILWQVASVSAWFFSAAIYIALEGRSVIAAALPVATLALTIVPLAARDHLLGAGASPGKALFGLRVIDARSGQPAGLAACIKRTLALLTPLSAIIAALQVGGGQRLGDHWAGTMVIWTRHREQAVFRPSLGEADHLLQNIDLRAPEGVTLEENPYRAPPVTVG